MTIATNLWKQKMREAYQLMLEDLQIKGSLNLNGDHLEDTPDRVVRMLEDSLYGVPLEKAGDILKAGFELEQGISEMVSVGNIRFISWCVHHLVPIICVGYFAYVPNKTIVGLSKIPRLIEAVARRPQVQERLTQQVTEIFERTLAPQGCGFVVDAQHMCMIARGVKQYDTWARTTALQGVFYSKPEARQEFLASIPAKPW